MYIHRRQFTIGPKKYILNNTWKAYQLNHSIWLSCCPELRVIKAKDVRGHDWYIIGIAVETAKEKISPENEIARAGRNQVPDLYSSWAGRWALVGNGKLHLDACGLLGCFYGKTSKGKLWASSSAALLVKILYHDRSPVFDTRMLRYEIGISWYTPPNSRFEGISRLLPSPVLDLQSGNVQPRPLMPEICLDKKYGDILDQIQQSLVTTLQNVAKLSTQLWLGLTAGYDSRLILALSHISGIKVRPFTRVTSRMSVADRILPPKLSQECDFTHVFICNQKRIPERKRSAEEHTAGHVSEGDAEPFIKGSRDQLRGISFGGHGFSIASGFGRLHELPDSVTTAEMGARQISKIFKEPVDSSAISGIKSWLSWALKHSQKNLNWRDRFFIEQRQAGWLSSKEQLYDLTDLVRFPIINSSYLHSLLLSVRKDKRIGSRIQEDLLERINPRLTKYPFNPNDFHFNPLQVIVSKGKDLPQYIYFKLVTKGRKAWNSLTFKC